MPLFRNPFRRRGEVTSKEVASRASWLLKSGSFMLEADIRQLRRMDLNTIADNVDAFRVAARSVAGSALGQAPGRKGGE